MKIYLYLLGFFLALNCGKGSSNPPFFILPSSSSPGEGGVTTSVGEGATLKKLQLEPPSISIAQNTHASFSVIAIYSDGSKLDVTQSANWESDRDMIEPDGNIEVRGSGKNRVLVKSGASSAGQSTVRVRFRGKSPGKTKLKAIYESLSAECELNIKGISIERIEISHYDFIPVNTTVPFKAIAILADGSTQDISDSVNWSVSSNTYGTIDSLGNFTSLGSGNVEIIASIGGLSFSTESNISKSRLTSLTLMGNSAIVKGTLSKFTVRGVYEDGSSADVTNLVTWSIDNQSIALVDYESVPGMVYGNGIGSTMLEVRLQGIETKENIKVNSPLITALSVIPKVSSPRGVKYQYRSLATFTDGSIQDVTTQTTWISENPALLSISNQLQDSGSANPLGVGVVTISASISGVQTFSTFTITPALLKSISINGESTIPKGISSRLNATGYYTDGTTKDITTEVTWFAGNGTISNFPEDIGTFQGNNPGNYKITAKLGNIQSTVLIEVGSAVLKSISISSSKTELAKGMELSYFATGILTDNSKVDLSKEVTWITDSNGDGVSDTSLAKFIDNNGTLKALNPGSIKIIAQVESIKAFTTLTINPAVLVSISMGEPQSISNGLQGGIRAVGTFSDGSTKDITSEVIFQINGSVYIDQTTGKITTNGVGVSTITATLGDVSTVTTFHVTQATLSTINITPGAGSIAKGTYTDLRATGIFTDGTTVDLSSQITWSIDGNGDGLDDSLIATLVRTENGLIRARGVNPGNAKIQGFFEGKSITIPLEVSPARLVSISLGTNHSLANGLKEQIRAIGTYSDNSTMDITGSVVWSTTGKASVRNDSSLPGILHTAGEETVTITATMNDVSGTLLIQVLPAEVVSLTLSQAELTLPRGTSRKISVNGTFTDGSTRDITGDVTFTSDGDGDGLDDSLIASVSNINETKGIIKGLQLGTSTLTVTLGKKSISTNISVTPAELLSISITPSSSSLPKGLKQRMGAMGFYSDSSSKDLTEEVTWNIIPANSGLLLPISSALTGSNATEIAGISNAAGYRGEVTAIQIGTVDVVASFQNITGKTPLTVAPAVLKSIYVSSPLGSKPKGLTEQFVATGYYSDNSSVDLTKSVSWKSDSNGDSIDDTNVLQISNEANQKGLGFGKAEGETTVFASMGSISGSKNFKITKEVLVSLGVESPNSSRPKGLTENFTALATFSDGSIRDVTNSSTWTADSNGDGINDTNIGSISNASGSQGVLTTLNTGSVTITANYSGTQNSKIVTVLPANLIGIIVSPPTASIVKGFVQQFTATGYYTDNSIQDISQNVTWRVDSNGDLLDDNLVGSISNQSQTKGITVGINPGKATVSATFGGFVYSSMLTVLNGTTAGGSGGNVHVDEISSGENNFNFQTNRVIGISATVINQNGAPVPGALVELYHSGSNALLFSQISSNQGKITGSVVVNYTDTEILATLSANVTANGTKQIAVPVRREVNGDIKLVVTILGVQVDNNTGGGAGGTGGSTGGGGGTTISDKDGDGVPDSKDLFPDDPSRAFKLRIPAVGYYTVSFEDLYPKAGDADLNDFTLYMYNEEDINSQGQIVEIRSTFQHVAKGAGYNHTLNLRLPPGISVSQFTTTIFDSRGVNLNSGTTLQNPSSSATRTLSIYNNQQSNVTLTSSNVGANQTFVPGRIAKTRIRFTNPVNRDILGTAPYDLYAFVINTGKEIHFPGKYFGNVFGAGKDDYLDSIGFPWAIIVPGEFKWPLEQQNIYNAYPKFRSWSSSKGAYDSDWYMTLDMAKAYTRATGPSGNFFQ